MFILTDLNYNEDSLPEVFLVFFEEAVESDDKSATYSVDVQINVKGIDVR